MGDESEPTSMALSVSSAKFSAARDTLPLLEKGQIKDQSLRLGTLIPNPREHGKKIDF